MECTIRIERRNHRIRRAGQTPHPGIREPMAAVTPRLGPVVEWLNVDLPRTQNRQADLLGNYFGSQP
jgi:hypothetical protein